MRISSIGMMILIVVLNACGGGGGSGSGSGGSNTSYVINNSNIISYNTAPDFTEVKSFISPDIHNISFSAQINFVKLIDGADECVVSQGGIRDWRLNPNSSPLIPDHPFEIFCPDSNGKYVESSLRLFGSKINVNGDGSFPTIADFNNDGKDDIFIVQSWDGAARINKGFSIISAPSNGFILKQVALAQAPTAKYTSMDINSDGCMDVVGPSGWVALGDCNGNFQESSYVNSFGGEFGSAACSGDFLGIGKKQLLITDGWLGGDANPNSIYEVDANLVVQNRHFLPQSHFKTIYNRNDGAHAYYCAVIDINNDGQLDIVLMTSNWYISNANLDKSKSKIEIYINKGGFTFENVTATAMAGYDELTSTSYSPRFVDLNNDGYVDIAIESYTYSGRTNGNQIWLNNKNNTFKKINATELSELYQMAGVKYGGTTYPTVLSMLPIKINGKWDYFIHLEDAHYVHRFGIESTQFIFR